MKSMRDIFPGLELAGNYFVTATDDPIIFLMTLPYTILCSIRTGRKNRDALVLYHDEAQNRYAVCYFGEPEATAEQLLHRAISYNELEQLRQSLIVDLNWKTAQETADWLYDTLPFYERFPIFAQSALTVFGKKGVHPTTLKKLIGDMTEYHEPDDDLELCFADNSKEIGFPLSHIVNVVAEVPGHNDDLDWHWILLLRDKRYCYLSSWCNFTGWGSASGITDIEFAQTAEQAAAFAPQVEPESKRRIQRYLLRQIRKEQPFGTYDSKI